MNHADDPFLPMPRQTLADDFAALALRDTRRAAASGAFASGLAPVVGRLRGFDLLDRPEVHQLPGDSGQRLVARSVVPLRLSQVGSEVLVVFQEGDVQRPIILGVLEPQGLAPACAAVSATSVQVDGERQLIEAEREIVLRCGDASITLTRAGKVIIQGRYILSHSSGYNKIKGAAIDIN